MSDIISIAVFVGCLLATFGLVRVCEWLGPLGRMRRPELSGSREAVARRGAGGEGGQ